MQTHDCGFGGAGKQFSSESFLANPVRRMGGLLF
jgi:hypothetical protein